jgi:hypothetical protein
VDLTATDQPDCELCPACADTRFASTQRIGFGVLRSNARDSLRRPKVIVLTNFGLQQYRREAEALGADVLLDNSRDYFLVPALLNDFANARRNENAPYMECRTMSVVI